jgi:arylsulfatase A-like enzyme
MKRRDFIKDTGIIAGTAVATDLALAGGSWAGQIGSDSRPNVLLIMTDQQSADALSCRMGTQFVKTPAMDSIAAEGVSFTRAYSPNPLCVPARTSMFTGQCPHTTGIQFNDTKASLVGKYQCLGTIFQDAGYETGYFGKWHLPYPVAQKETHGFATMGAMRNDGVDKEIPALAERFIRQKRQRPFLLVTAFVNPHNICEWPRGEELLNGPVGTPPSVDKCPPMLNNHLPMENETDIMLLTRLAYQGSSKFPVGDFNEKKWREYRWAYFRMIEMVDSHIAKVLQALRESGQRENTLVVFSSDHGDCQGAHGWNQKTVFYDEASRVPFIVSLPGTTKGKTSDTLVNTGIDLLPTLCAFAGIQVPGTLPGANLKNVIAGVTGTKEREYIVSENKMMQGVEIDSKKPQPGGRMVRSKQFKYCVFDEGKRNESLIDMERDPGEMTNLAGKSEFAEVLKQHRAYLAEWCHATGDPFMSRG